VQVTNLCCGKFLGVFSFPVYIHSIIMYSLLFTVADLKLITSFKSILLSRLFFENAGLWSSLECMQMPFKTLYVTKTV
jgi:hypothetical protein